MIICIVCEIISDLCESVVCVIICIVFVCD